MCALTVGALEQIRLSKQIVAGKFPVTVPSI